MLQNQPSFMMGFVTFLSLAESMWLPKLALYFLIEFFILTIFNENVRRASELPFFLFINCLLFCSPKRILYNWKQIQCCVFFNQSTFHRSVLILPVADTEPHPGTESGFLPALLGHSVEATRRSRQVLCSTLSWLSFVWIWGSSIIHLENMWMFYDFSRAI